MEGDILPATCFGYFVADTLPQVSKASYCCFLNESNLGDTFKKFFEVESLTEFFIMNEKLFSRTRIKLAVKEYDLL